MTVIFIISPILRVSIIRTILGLPMTLFIPGYVLLSSLFPKKDDLGIIERLTLSFGLSIAIVPLIGLILNYTFGIRLIPIITFLTIFDLFMIFITNYRRESLAEDQRYSVPIRLIYNNSITKFDSKTKIDKILTIGLLFSIVLAISMLLYVIATPKTGEKFTEFYVLNSSAGKADNYSKDLKLKSPTTLLVGVINHEFTNINYTVQINMDNHILITKNIELKNNDTWEKNITFVPDKEGDHIKLEFLLFKEKNFAEPYRELHLWENVTR